MLSRALFGASLRATTRHHTLTPFVRYASNKRDDMDDYEEFVYDLLDKELEPTSLVVRDVSGGCGSMFAISVESPKFNGMTMIKQHRLVNEVLKQEISKWHGLQLKTKKAKA